MEEIITKDNEMEEEEEEENSDEILILGFNDFKENRYETTQTARKCSPICFYESFNDDETHYNNENSIEMVQLACGHYFHDKCLRWYFKINYNTKEEITHNTVIKCPVCIKNVVVL
ncbi:hypothetical protein U3516DRAFT_823557 [Neocallimastix sp. 'constans']